jgi:hypothetical protein
MKGKMKRNKICPICGKEFVSYRNNQAFCSNKCRFSKGINFVEKKCVICGSKFNVKKTKIDCYKSKYNVGSFCSRECFNIKQRKNTIQKCDFCGEEFYNSPANKRKFCCMDCYRKAQKFSGNYLYPSYNKKSCEFFFKLNKELGLNGRFATNGREKLFVIDGKRIWTDYYEPNLNLVIEWDEESHYFKNKLKADDIKRQNVLESYLGKKIYRIREKFFNENKERDNIKEFINE